MARKGRLVPVTTYFTLGWQSCAGRVERNSSFRALPAREKDVPDTIEVGRCEGRGKRQRMQWRKAADGKPQAGRMLQMEPVRATHALLRCAAAAGGGEYERSLIEGRHVIRSRKGRPSTGGPTPVYTAFAASIILS